MNHISHCHQAVELLDVPKPGATNPLLRFEIEDVVYPSVSGNQETHEIILAWVLRPQSPPAIVHLRSVVQTRVLTIMIVAIWTQLPAQIYCHTSHAHKWISD